MPRSFRAAHYAALAVSRLALRIARLGCPTLTVFGSADDHFADPVAEAASTAGTLAGQYLVVDGAGHYPHVEQPELVADAIVAFIETNESWDVRA